MQKFKKTKLRLKMHKKCIVIHKRLAKNTNPGQKPAKNGLRKGECGRRVGILTIAEIPAIGAKNPGEMTKKSVRKGEMYSQDGNPCALGTKICKKQ